MAGVFADCMKRVRETLPEVNFQPHPWLKWLRDAQGHWRPQYGGETQPQFDFGRDLDWDELAAPFDSVLASVFPEQVGTTIGTLEMSQHASKPAWILRQSIGALLRREPYTLSDERILETATTVASAFARPTVSIRYLAPLLNFKMLDDRLSLPDGSSIERLSEQDATLLYGGFVYNGPAHDGNTFAGPANYIWHGLLDSPKLVGGKPVAAPPPNYRDVQAVLERLTMGMRTFQRGPVGSSGISFVPLNPTPMVLGAMVTRQNKSEYVPYGDYTLAAESVAPFIRHCSLFDQNFHPSFANACRRLGTASVRTDPQDRLIDAVVGLEAVLLGALKSDHSELSFRFALHYAKLAAEPARERQRFDLAKLLYDLRSSVAHGGQIGKKLNRRMTEFGLALPTAADAACEALRELVKRYLPERCRPPYLDPEYWAARYISPADPSAAAREA